MPSKFKEVDFIILGAGPSGLSLARSLLDNGVTSFIVLEKDKSPGGLCQSKMVDGAPLDIYGAHIMDVRRKPVLDFLFRFLPESEWNFYNRCSKIQIHGRLIDYPIEANVWQLPTDLQVKYLRSLFRARFSKKRKPRANNFEEWIYKKFGGKIATKYMIPYNKKIWGEHYSSLSTEWLHKLPDINFDEMLTSCLERTLVGKLPGHANFYYPKKGGFGSIWNNMAETLKEQLLLNTPVSSFDHRKLLLNGEYKAKKVITTIPWSSLMKVSKFPKIIEDKIYKLKSISLQIDYFKENLDSPAHWTYIPDKNISYHRILHRNNIVPNSRGYWTETNPVNLQGKEKPRSLFTSTAPYAYPVNTRGKTKLINQILKWGEKNNIYGLGRWGKWDHMNSDVAVEQALAFSSSMIHN